MTIKITVSTDTKITRKDLLEQVVTVLHQQGFTVGHNYTGRKPKAQGGAAPEGGANGN